MSSTDNNQHKGSFAPPPKGTHTTSEPPQNPEAGSSTTTELAEQAEAKAREAAEKAQAEAASQPAKTSK